MSELEVGDEITARVARVAQFGVFLSHQGQSVLVRLTDLSRLPIHGELAKVGDQLRVQILHVSKNEIIGSALPFLP